MHSLKSALLSLVWSKNANDGRTVHFEKVPVRFECSGVYDYWSLRPRRLCLPRGVFMAYGLAASHQTDHDRSESVAVVSLFSASRWYIKDQLYQHCSIAL